MFKIKIDELDNDAFHGEPHFEMARILRLIAVRLDSNNSSIAIRPPAGDSCGGPLIDINGNVVGTWEWKR